MVYSCLMHKLSTIIRQTPSAALTNRNFFFMPTPSVTSCLPAAQLSNVFLNKAYKIKNAAMKWKMSVCVSKLEYFKKLDLFYVDYVFKGFIWNTFYLFFLGSTGRLCVSVRCETYTVHSCLSVCARVRLMNSLAIIMLLGTSLSCRAITLHPVQQPTPSSVMLCRTRCDSFSKQHKENTADLFYFDFLGCVTAAHI